MDINEEAISINSEILADARQKESDITSVEDNNSSMTSGNNYVQLVNSQNTHSVNCVCINHAKTLSEGFNEWCQANIGSRNSYKYGNTNQNWEKHILPTLGENTPIRDVNSANINALLTSMECIVSKRTVLTVYYSGRVVFEFFIQQGYILSNAFEEAKEKYGWTNGKYPKGRFVDGATIKEIIKSMLSANKNIHSLRAVLFAWLAYYLRKAPNSILTMKWNDPNLSQLDPLGQKLLNTYRELFDELKNKKNLTNPNNWLFISLRSKTNQFNMAYRSFAAAWMRKNVFAPLSLSGISINSMRSKNASRDGLKFYKPSKKYQIFK